MNTTKTRSGSRRRFGILLSAAATMASLSVIVAPTPAHAETDGFPEFCITKDGTTRACMTYGRMNWGTGWRWTANASIRDKRDDNTNVSLQVMLDRKGVSDTGWITVVTASDLTANSDSETGLDPTNGAWYRLCVGNYCSAKSSSRHVVDNS